MYLFFLGLEAQRGCNRQSEESECRYRCERDDWICEDEGQICREDDVCCCDD